MNYTQEEHPIATGGSAVRAGATGKSIGLAVAGFLGAVIGGVVGAVTSGFGGRAMAAKRESTGGPEESESAPFEELIVPPTHEVIAERAWKYFERDGRTDGHDLDDWLRAERDLLDGVLGTKGEVVKS